MKVICWLASFCCIPWLDEATWLLSLPSACKMKSKIQNKSVRDNLKLVSLPVWSPSLKSASFPLVKQVTCSCFHLCFEWSLIKVTGLERAFQKRSGTLLLSGLVFSNQLYFTAPDHSKRHQFVRRSKSCLISGHWNYVDIWLPDCKAASFFFVSSSSQEDEFTFLWVTYS